MSLIQNLLASSIIMHQALRLTDMGIKKVMHLQLLLENLSSGEGEGGRWKLVVSM